MGAIVEQGDLFFFYRPRVGVDEAHALEDVQRFFLIMHPDRSRRFREIIVGRKRLPDTRAHEREWAFVAEVTDTPDKLRDALERREYETRTRGRRVQPPARPAGEARYAIATHERHTHLAYVLELPREPGPAQRAFNIDREASYVIAVRNPDAPAPPGAGLGPHQRADLPAHLRERFDGRRWAAVDTPELLDREGVELVLIGTADDVRRELGIELDADDERLQNADLFEQLRIRPTDLPTDPLERGELR